MITKIWDVTAEKLTDRWLATSLSALMFWLIGLAAWVWHDKAGVDAVLRAVERQSTVTQIAIIVMIGLVVSISGIIVGELASPALRLLEGYWPSFARPLRYLLTIRTEARAARLDKRFQQLSAEVYAGRAGQEELAEFAKVDVQRRRLPSDGRFLPTRVGNILRAMESRTTAKYGFGSVAVWPHLWLLLPESAQRELITARTRLLGSVKALLWSILLLCFTPLAWWTAVLSVLSVLAVTVVPLRTRTAVFADLVEASYDLYKDMLYRQVRWPLPSSPGEAQRSGELLATYLIRGLDDAQPRFSDAA